MHTFIRRRNTDKIIDVELFDYNELIDCFVESLDILSDWNDNKILSKADGFKYAIFNFEFLIPLLVVSNIFSLGLLLSKYFQDAYFN